MDARSTVPGLDTPQTRQRFAPGLTSAPQRLHRKARTMAASSLEHLFIENRASQPSLAALAFSRQDYIAIRRVFRSAIH
jgi:hypothetical protein